MVEPSPQILASEENATNTVFQVRLQSQRPSLSPFVDQSFFLVNYLVFNIQSTAKVNIHWGKTKVIQSHVKVRITAYGPIASVYVSREFGNKWI